MAKKSKTRKSIYLTARECEYLEKLATAYQTSESEAVGEALEFLWARVRDQRDTTTTK